MIRLAQSVPVWARWAMFALWLALAGLWMTNAPIMASNRWLGWVAALAGLLLAVLIFEVVFILGRKILRRPNGEGS